MSVLGRILVSSAERIDLADLLSIDSYVGGDFKYLLKGLVGDDIPYVLKGFEIIDAVSAKGTTSCSIKVADSVVFFPGSDAGSFFYGLPEGDPMSLPLVPELHPQATNYVYITLTTTTTSSDSRGFWDPDKDGGAGGEFPRDVNTESVLSCQVGVSVASFPTGTVPIAKIGVDVNNQIETIEDCRNMLFRLGSGGINPDPLAKYSWRSLPSSTYRRVEPATSLVETGDPNPFQGADKNIWTLKEWMDAVMSKLQEFGGTTFWYQDISTYSLISMFTDALATSFKSKGQWLHDDTTPGLLSWTEDLTLKMTADPRSYVIRGPGTSSPPLANEQVMYVELVRNQPINTLDLPILWKHDEAYLTSDGAVGLFKNLHQGDFIKKVTDPDQYFLRVEEFYTDVTHLTATQIQGDAKAIRLSGTYLGTGDWTAVKARYDRGIYDDSEAVVVSRNDPDITAAAGNYHWMAIRSDSIQQIATIATTTLTIDIDEHDGKTARCTVTATDPVTVPVAHNLVDGDRITIAGTTNFNGTYIVEVEDTTTFYVPLIHTPVYADETGKTAFYALVTTTQRENSADTPLVEESANHCFHSNDRIIIAGVTGVVAYNGSYQISRHSPTTFTIPVASALGAAATGTATLAQIEVRSEAGAANIVQGEIVNIGDDSTTIQAFIGMQSLAETHPSYRITLPYNTLDGMVNYNSLASDDMTVRVSQLTAMMADKAQDKTVKYIPSNFNTVTNTTNVAAQELTFGPAASTLMIALPGSDGLATIALPSATPGISLDAYQVAYVTVDRNAISSPSIETAQLSDLSIDENIFVIAVRLGTTVAYLWDGYMVPVGIVPMPVYATTIAEQNVNAKLVQGGTWLWTFGTTTLSWSANAYIEIPGLLNTYNLISAGSASLPNATSVVYVEINRLSPGGTIVPTIADVDDVPLDINTVIVAMRDGNDILVGTHPMRLVGGESKKLDAGASDQTMTYVGAADESDSDPDYGAITVTAGSLDEPNYNATEGDDLTERLAIVTAMLADVRQDLNIEFDPGTIVWDGAKITITGASLSIPGTTVGAAAVAITDYPETTLLAEHCIYVDISRTAGTTLGRTDDLLTNLTPSQQRLIIARRVGNNILTR